MAGTRGGCATGRVCPSASVSSGPTPHPWPIWPSNPASAAARPSRTSLLHAALSSSCGSVPSRVGKAGSGRIALSLEARATPGNVGTDVFGKPSDEPRSLGQARPAPEDRCRRRAGQIPPVLEQVAFHRVGKPPAQRRYDLRIGSGVTAQPPERLDHRGRRSPCPPQDARRRVAEPDGPTVDLERPGVAIRHVGGLARHGIRETQLIRGHQAVGHDPDTVTPR